MERTNDTLIQTVGLCVIKSSYLAINRRIKRLDESRLAQRREKSSSLDLKYFGFRARDVNEERIICRASCRVIEASANTPQTAG